MRTLRSTIVVTPSAIARVSVFDLNYQFVCVFVWRNKKVSIKFIWVIYSVSLTRVKQYNSLRTPAIHIAARKFAILNHVSTLSNPKKRGKQIGNFNSIDQINRSFTSNTKSDCHEKRNQEMQNVRRWNARFKSNVFSVACCAYFSIWDEHRTVARTHTHSQQIYWVRTFKLCCSIFRSARMPVCINSFRTFIFNYFMSQFWHLLGHWRWHAKRPIRRKICWKKRKRTKFGFEHIN